MSASVTKANRAPIDSQSDPSPEYLHAPNENIAVPTDVKVEPSHENFTKPAEKHGKRESSTPGTEPSETGGDDVSTATSASHLRREEQLSRHAVGTFADGAVTANPMNDPGASLKSRSAIAEAELSKAAKSKIRKAEAKNSKQMSKILNSEAKSQTVSLQAAVKELAQLQKVQKEAAAEETKALRRHTKAISNEQKQYAIFIKAKAASEAAMVELRSAAENLEATRTHARQQTEALKTKALEVEQAMRQKATDDRERQVKLGELNTARAK